jgi:predicted nucleic acid-binding protein
VAKFTVIYDACVLYPAPLRDLLMHLAVTDLFKAHWTDQIHEEWIRALLRSENRFDRSTLEKTRDLMDRHVFDAKVTGYEKLIPVLELPDSNDRHVLAAAIKAGADAIITFNLKDFPREVLAEYSIEAIHPDDFIYCQIGLSSAVACGAVKRHRESLKKPPKTKAEYLETLSKQALPQTVSELKEYIDLI